MDVGAPFGAPEVRSGPWTLGVSPPRDERWGCTTLSVTSVLPLAALGGAKYRASGHLGEAFEAQAGVARLAHWRILD